MAYAQEEEQEEAPAYQTMYDDPYDIRNLYIMFQPLYGDVGAINITGGFGIEGAYYHESLFDLQLSFRTSYGRKFDINREGAVNNATNNDTYPAFYSIEFGGTYHIKDLLKESSSDVLLYSKQLSGSDWAATIPRHAEINSKVRTIIGGRLGGNFTNTTANVSDVLSVQGQELAYSDGTPVFDENLYSSLQTFVIYVGGSYSWIRNYAVEFSERWDPAGDDQIFTPYFDVMFAPSINLQDVTLGSETISTESIEKLAMGFRGGLNVKFNRKFSWGYGVEAGVRPGLKKRGFFVAFKMSFPIYGRKLNGEADSQTETEN